MTDFNRRSFLSFIPAVSLAGTGAFGKLPSFQNSSRMRYSDIPFQFIHPDTHVLVTSAYARHGDLGSATYVSDHLATPELAALTPRFCTIGPDGRCWRAIANHEGLVPVVAGGVIGSLKVKLSNLGNQQPAIAQALAYQQAIGAGGLVFGDGNYDIWCPKRTAVDDNINLDKTGISFLIRGPTVFQAGPNGTTFNRRKFDGSDPAVFTGTQYLNFDYNRDGQGIYWRGGMFMLVGTTGLRSSYTKLTTLHLKGNWTINGGILQSQKNADVFLPGSDRVGGLCRDGSGWDVTDKPIWAENDRNTGDIIFDGDIVIGGFRGELTYQGGNTHGSIYQTGSLTLHDTDGDGFNPGPSFSNGTRDGFGTVQMQSLTIKNAFQALEGATGWNGSIASLNIDNCTQGGGLMSGVWGPAAQPSNRPIPVLNISELMITRTNNYTALNGNSIQQIDVTDGSVSIGQSNWYTYNVAIGKITVTADKGNVADGLIFQSQYYSSNEASTSNNRIGLVTFSQTPAAKLAKYGVVDPVDWAGYLGTNNVVDELAGVTWSAPFARNPASVTGLSPQINDVNLTHLSL